MLIRYDSEADAAYVELRPDAGHTTGTRLDEQRIVHRDDEGNPVAVALLFVSRGVDLTGLPEAERIAEAMRRVGRLAPA